MNILITGGTSGIGINVAKRVSLNNKVYLGIHTDNQLKITERKLSNYKNIIPIKLDITNKKDIKKLINYNIDTVFLNAGVGYGGSVIDIPLKRFKDNFNVNVFGNFEVLRIVIKKMIFNKAGRIVVMSSLLGIAPFKFLGIYSATKSAIISLTVSLKKELKMLNKNIKVCLIEPGAYKTGFNQIMLENKYDYFKKSYFKHLKLKIYNKESLIFKLIEQKSLDSIVSKIEDALTSEKPKFIYRAPLLQVIFIKLYNFIFM